MQQAPKEIMQLSYQAILIGLITFIFPIWICSGINLGAVLLKMLEYYSNKLPFWENTALVIVIGLLVFIPFVYIIWFYYLTLQRLFRKIYEKVLVHWHREIANIFSTHLIQWYEKYDQQKEAGATMVNSGEFLEYLLAWINEKIETWPKVVSWPTKKLLMQIPFVDLIIEYHQGNLDYRDHPKIVEEVSGRFDKLVEEAIEGFVPQWTYFIIPINLLLLFLLWYAF